jgi:glycosyltransferase involved in cell wall biosynthesis
LKILIITHVFYPDTVSVSQHYTDIAETLKEHNHKVEVLTSRYPYEDIDLKYLKKEDYNSIRIKRLWQTKFGKKFNFLRIFNFLTFNLNVSIELFFKSKKSYDVIFCSTSPPLLAFACVCIGKIKKKPVYYWVMDMQPELSIASGLIKKDSFSANFFSSLSNYSLKNSAKIFSLDRFMTSYISSKEIDITKISTIPVWPVLNKVYAGERLQNPFRIENNFKDRIVIMYSGNHAYVHPLDTLLNSALLLKQDKQFLFVFIGGGVRKKDVTDFKRKHNLDNIVQLPFQPRENIHLSLGSADLQVVVLGDGQVGYTHPNKVYGALFLGKPIIYIGPNESHVSDIINNLEGNISINHGEQLKLKEKIVEFSSYSSDYICKIVFNNKKYAEDNLEPKLLKQKMLNEFKL